MNVGVLTVQVPFVRGGAEVLVEGLVDALRAAGHQATAISVPFRWYPVAETLTAATIWRMLDLRESNGVPLDRLICMKYPTWAVRHPNKIAWIMHQHRQAYDWYGTALSDFTSAPEDVAIRRGIQQVDHIGLGECRRIFTISTNVAQRLKRYTGMDARVLTPPTSLTGLACEQYDAFFLSVARLDRAKRIDLFIDALARCKRPVRGVIVGSGSDEAALRQRAAQAGLSGRLCFAGRVGDAELARLYNTCRAVVYAPIDEDYGYATLEAMLASKPVLTATDSGGTLEFVDDGVTGAVRPPEPDRFAAVLDAWDADDAVCRRLGMDALRRVAGIRWETIVPELLR